MRTLKLTIEGDYWDCQIYRGSLYVWTMDGKLMTYDWPRLVESLVERPTDKLPLFCAFRSGSYLYAENVSLFTGDREVRNILDSRTAELAARDLTIDRRRLTTFERGVQVNPFPSLPIDSEIYYERMYVASDGGVFAATCPRAARLKYPVSSRPRKLWDCKVLGLRASHRKLALAAGDDGLCEYDLSDGSGATRYDVAAVPIEASVMQLSERHCSSVSWAFASIFASSHVGNSYLAGFGWEGQRGVDLRRAFRTLVDQSSIFDQDGFAFGAGEKLYLARDSHVDAVRFTQSELVHNPIEAAGTGDDITEDDPAEEVRGPFQRIGTLEESDITGPALSGDVAAFGTVVEIDGGLAVLRSDGGREFVKGPVTRWRVYHRSVDYDNQLHVILDDRLEIYAYLHDAWVDQQQKVAGLRADATGVGARPAWRSRRTPSE